MVAPYVNGAPVANGTFTKKLCAHYDVSIGALLPNSTYTNGYIADVQVYNASMGAKQVSLLYSEGPTSTPINSTSHLVGWWPLNGNANDYSGYGGDGTQYNITFNGIVQVQAQLFSHGGAGLSGIPIGFVTTNNLISGTNSLAGITNSSGFKNLLLTSSGFTGTTLVYATAYNGNTSDIPSLSRWWPLDMNPGSSYVEDISGNGKNGTFINPGSTQLVNRTLYLTGIFNGANTIVKANTMNISATNITIAAWVNNFGGTLFPENIAEAFGNQNSKETFGIGVGSPSSFGNVMVTWSNAGSTFQDQASGGVIEHGGWYLVVGEWSGRNNTLSVYLNGTLVATATGNGTTSTTIGGINIGGAYAGSNYFAGRLSNIQVYNSLLSQSQIDELLGDGPTSAPLPYTGIVGWWPLSGGTNNYIQPNLVTSTSSGNLSYVEQSEFVGKLLVSAPISLFNGQSSYVKFPSGVLPSSGLCHLTIVAWSYDMGMSAAGRGGVYNFSGSGQASLMYNDTNFTFTLENATKANSWSTPNYHRNEVWIFSALELIGGYPVGYVGSGGGAKPLRSPSTGPGGGANSIGCIGLSAGTLGKGTRYFNGSIVDVQVYNSSLTYAQLQQLYQQGIPPVETLNVSLG